MNNPGNQAEFFYRRSHLVLRVRGSSMWPLLRAGDYVLVQRQNHMRPGAILAFRQRGTPITHRIHRVIHLDAGTAFHTKGDANFRRDPQVSSSHVLGVVVARVRRKKYSELSTPGLRVAGKVLPYVAPIIAATYRSIVQAGTRQGGENPSR
jgi:signal peptidase I